MFSNSFSNINYMIRWVKWSVFQIRWQKVNERIRRGMGRGGKTGASFTIGRIRFSVIVLISAYLAIALLPWWRLYWNTGTSVLGSSHHNKRRDGRSFGMTPTWRNIPSMSAKTTCGCWWKRISTWIKFCSDSGRVKSALFCEWPWNLSAPLRTLRTLPGLCGWNSGWCGKYYSRCCSVLKQVDF